MSKSENGEESKSSEFEISSDVFLSSNECSRIINKLKRKLDGATYYSDKILDDLYPSVPSQDPFCTEFMKNYPGSDFSSPVRAARFFEPLTAVLNSIKQEAKQRKLLERSIYKDVEFEVYNREMTDSSQNDKIKPQIIARIPSLSQTASWKEVEFFVRVDSNFPLLIAHAATCAKMIFKLQCNRLFVLGIFFEHRTLEISFGIFHAMGLILPRKRYKLDDVQGYQEFVQVMVRVYSSSHRWRAGFDETCNNEKSHIAGLGTYLYLENLSYHAKFGARGTRVDKMKLMEAPKLKATSPNLRFKKHTLSSSHIARNDYNDNLQSPPSKRTKFERFHIDNTDLAFPAYLPITSYPHACENAPQLLILKDSWPLESRWDIESRMFQDVKGYFGIPEVYPGYKVIHSNAEAETDFFSRDDLEKCDVLGSYRNPEPRAHVRLPIVTEGVPLTEATSPRVLVLGILHAMVGHWHLLKAGWLHRDVSIGNVLLRKTARQGLKIEGLDLDGNSSGYFSECTSFIADGDLAVRWREEKDLLFSLLGTRPFMSLGILSVTGYRVSNSLPYMHTAVDDLESFIWVFIWAILEIIPKETWAPLEREIHFYLNIDTVPDLRVKRNTLGLLMEAIELDSIERPWISAGFKVFAPLLIDWLTISKRTITDIQKHKFNPPNPLDYYRTLYHNYMAPALNIIDKLPESWSYMRSQS